MHVVDTQALIEAASPPERRAAPSIVAENESIASSNWYLADGTQHGAPAIASELVNGDDWPEGRGRIARFTPTLLCEVITDATTAASCLDQPAVLSFGCWLMNRTYWMNARVTRMNG